MSDKGFEPQSPQRSPGKSRIFAGFAFLAVGLVQTRNTRLGFEEALSDSGKAVENHKPQLYTHIVESPLYI
jgi:hypothetical protein